MAAYIEPIGFGTETFGPFADEIEASEALDSLGLSDSDYKIVIR